jgi:hypothetical protein
LDAPDDTMAGDDVESFAELLVDVAPNWELLSRLDHVV